MEGAEREKRVKLSFLVDPYIIILLLVIIGKYLSRSVFDNVIKFLLVFVVEGRAAGLIEFTV